MSAAIEHAWDRIGAPLEEIDTPALLVDLDALDRNIQRMAAFGRQCGVGIRPHAKAHKTPIIAHMQLRSGAVGLCCQKVGEAEVMVAAGVGDVLVTNEIVGAAKVARLVRLARHARIAVAVDSLAAAEALSGAAAATGVEIGLVVDVDVGQRRCGVQPGPPAAALAEQLVRLPALRLLGLQGYQGALQHVAGYEERVRAATEANARLLETRQLFEARGFSLEVVTGAGTGTYEAEGRLGSLTDVQPGSYIFMDAQYQEIGGRSGRIYEDFEPSLLVLTTVMSTPASDRVVVDAGLKAISNDAGVPRPFELKGWQYRFAGDEHGTLLRSDDGPPLHLGQTIRILPGHCDTTVNLFDRFHIVRDGRLEGIWAIAARGRTR